MQTTTPIEPSRSQDHPWAPYASELPVSVVVLLLDHRAGGAVPILRAKRLSNALGATLHAVLSLPDDATRFDTAHVAYVRRLLQHMGPPCDHELEIVRGSLEVAGLDVARELDPVVVVLDASASTGFACRIVDELGLPALVARDPRTGGELIAASDLGHTGLPVLSTARNYARALDRPVTYFHNVRPMPPFVGDPSTGLDTLAPGAVMEDEVVSIRMSRLRRFAGGEPDSKAILARENSTVEAILELVRDRGADLIVVGRDERSWLSRFLGRGVTERVIEESPRSVLVVPTEPERC